MKKKILILMPSMFIGGAERSLLGLLDSFDYDRYDVDLFLFRHEGEFLIYFLKCGNMQPLMFLLKICYLAKELCLGLRDFFLKLR